MKYAFPKASTSVIVPVFIQDSSSTTGAGLGSLDQTSSIVGGYVRPGGTGVALAVDENVTTEGTYEAPSTAAQVRIGTPANMRTGTYELHFHNDLLAVGADAVFITLGGATNMADLIIEIQLTDVDLNDGVRAGLTSLPNAAADANNGLVTGDGSVTLTAGVGNRPSVDATALGGTVQSATDLKDFADAGYDPGTNKVQGLVLVDTCTTLTSHTAQTGDNYARIGAPAGASVSADVAAVKTDTAAILVDTGTTLDGRIPAALVGGRMDSDVEAINNSTAAADQLALSAATIVSSTAKAGTLSTTQMSTNLTEVTNDHYNGRIVIWTSGVLQNQASDITDYVGVNGVLTYTAVTEAPSAADAFIIV